MVVKSQTAAMLGPGIPHRIFGGAQPRRSLRPAPYALDGLHTKSMNAKQRYSGTHVPQLLPVASARPSKCGMAGPSVWTSNSPGIVRATTTTPSTSARAAANTLMAHRAVLAERAVNAKTPYCTDNWERLLHSRGLFAKYSHIPQGLRIGFNLSIPQVHTTQIPPNRDSIVEYAGPFNDIVTNEIRKGRYIGTFTAKELEILIGPFQTLPFSIIPKPGRPGLFRVLQNFSYPHEPS